MFLVLSFFVLVFPVFLEELVLMLFLDCLLLVCLVFDFISLLRDKYNCHDDVVIYTGYNKEEIHTYIELTERMRRNLEK